MTIVNSVDEEIWCKAALAMQLSHNFNEVARTLDYLIARMTISGMDDEEIRHYPAIQLVVDRISSMTISGCSNTASQAHSYCVKKLREAS